MKKSPKKQSAKAERKDSKKPAFLENSRQFYICLFVVALLLRLIFTWEISGTPMANTPIGDGESYVRWAAEIAGGNWLGNEVFYAAPLYPYFLGVLFSLFGQSLFAVRFVQALLGACSCLLLARAGSHFFGKNPGRWGGFLLAIYPTAIYFDGLIQKASLAFFLFSGLLWCISRLRTTPSVPRWLGAGVLLGLLSITRENAIILLPVLLLWLAYQFRVQGWACVARWGGALVLGIFLVFFPLTLRNKLVADEWVLTTSNLGTNFYIGNNAEADGRYQPLRWGRGDWKFEYEDAVSMAREESGKSLSPGEVSGFWLRKTLGEIGDQPGRWVMLLGRKLLYVLNRVEIADTEDIYTYSDWSTVLGLLLSLFHFGFLFPLAAAGLYASRMDWQKLLPLYLIGCAYAAGVVLFFVFDRFRFPLVAVLILFAAPGIAFLKAAFSDKKHLGPLLAVLIGAGILANLPILDTRSFTSNSDLNVGKILAREGKHGEAVKLFEEALKQAPNSPDTLVSLANSYISLGRFDDALVRVDRAIELKPDFGEAYAQKGLAHLVKGNYHEAVPALEKALELDPGNPSVANNLAWILAASSDASLRRPERAIELALEAVAKVPDKFGYLDTLGVAYAAAGRFEEARDRALQAIDLARAQGKSRQASDIEGRLRLYENEQAYSE